MAEVIVYTTDYCPYCTRAKGLLQRKKIDFVEINVSNDPGKRAWLVEATKRRTVPQIFINGKAIGGSDELHALERDGKLDAMIAADHS
ncbi:MAG: glutaredoxin 3 [Deltaproteobacteria bacterium]|nr:glutaredoxin 3 [Deltaproteobacteria bacterium]